MTKELFPGDRISFSYRGNTLSGTISRVALKTAIVETEGGDCFRVSHSRLEREQGVAGRDLREVATLARALMNQHKLTVWTFEFDQAKRRGGACRYDHKIISMAAGFAKVASDADIRDTLLHEIAHALVGPRHGHDALWRAKALEIGCSAERCHAVTFSEPAFIALCPNGCFAIGRHRRRRNMHCERCGGHVVYERSKGRRK